MFLFLMSTGGWIIAVLVIIALLIVFFITGYVKAAPDTARLPLPAPSDTFRQTKPQSLLPPALSAVCAQSICAADIAQPLQQIQHKKGIPPAAHIPSSHTPPE